MSRMDEKIGPNPMKTTDVAEDKSHREEKGQQAEVRFRFALNSPRNLIAEVNLKQRF